MKKYVFIFVIFVSFLIISGCVHYPELSDMPDSSPASCLDYQRCLYYSAHGKAPMDCSKIYDRCDKDRAWIDCQKNRPDDMRFQECWDKLR